MTHAEVQTFLTALPAEKRPADAETLAREMFRQGRLTKFQAQAIFQGKTRGLVVGNYVVQDTIGKGGMGAVYKARHRKMDRLVAIKMLPSSAMKSPEAVKRFEREVKAAARLSHPNIVTAYDADEHNGVHFLVMEYVEGQDLASIVKQQGPLPVATAVDYIVQAAKGLEYAHGEGVIHRDIKPANLLVDRKGTVKILDMGLARVDGTAGAIDEGLTRDGQVMGTLDYMAPEQAMDTHRADARSDIYSLGCTLHYLLAGRGPFTGETVGQKIVAHREQPVPSLRTLRPDVPESLDAVFVKMLAKKPQDRQASMGEVIAQLQGCALPKTPAPVITQAAPGDVAETFSLRQGDIETSSEQIPADPLEEIAAAARDYRSIAPKPPAKKWLKQLGKRQKIGIGVALGLAFILVLLGVIFKLRTKDGTLIVEVSDPDVTVQVLNDEGKVQIERKGEKGTLTIAVDPGKHRLRVQKDGVEMFAKDVSIASGGTETIKAVLELPHTLSGEPEASKLATQATDPDRRAAEWVLRSGGVVTVKADGIEQSSIAKIGDLPPGKLEVTEAVFLDKPDVNDEGVRCLAGLRSLRVLTLQGTAITDSGLLALGPLPSLEHLNIIGTQITDEGIRCLAGMKKLQSIEAQETRITGRTLSTLANVPLGDLSLGHTKLDDAGLASAAALPSLHHLYIHNTLVTDKGLMSLKGHPCLQYLYMGSCSITDEGLSHLDYKSDWIELDVGNTKVTDRGLERLGPLSKLQALTIWGVQLTPGTASLGNFLAGLKSLQHLNAINTCPDNEHLKAIARLTTLRELDLTGAEVTDAGLEQLRGLKNLRRLLLSETKVSDQGLEHLRGLSDLIELHLIKTEVTAAGVAKLQAALPNCKIAVDPAIQAELDKSKKK
ncbi:MAG: protein kinase [Thermoguttaceae bacterium]